MPTNKALQRFALIIDKLKHKTYPSFESLSTFIKDQKDMEFSERTLQRDIKAIREEFGIEIVYDSQRKGYYINWDESVSNPESFLNFLEIVNTSDALSESLKDGKEALRYLHFGTSSTFKGIEYLRDILFAIKNHRVIHLTHQSFDKHTTSSYELQPCLLKEYLNRWYVVGRVPETKDIRTFGLDRITSLQLGSDVFDHRKLPDVSKNFDNIIGLVYSENEIREVVLSFTPQQGKYIKSLPLHHSQQVLVDTDKEFRISLFLIPNFELRQQILMYGSAAEVISPPELRAEVKKELAKAVEKYK